MKELNPETEREIVRRVLGELGNATPPATMCDAERKIREKVRKAMRGSMDALEWLGERSD